MMKLRRISALAVLFCILAALFSGCANGPFSDLLPNTEKEPPQWELPENTPLEYTLTEGDYTDYRELLKTVKINMLSAQTCEEAEAEMEPVKERLDYFRKQATIAELLYYCDQNSKERDEAFRYASEIQNNAFLDAVKLEEEIFKAAPPYRDEYFDGMTEETLMQIIRETNAERELEDLQTILKTQFYGMSKEDLKKNAHTLYTQMIRKGNETAAVCGYESFYDYAAENIYFRDFGKEEREIFRGYVKEYIVPLYQDSYTDFLNSFSKLSAEDKDLLIHLMDTTPYDRLDQNYLSDYLSSLSGSTKDGMNHMFENGYYIRMEQDSALQGALTTRIDDPFCYFGPGYYQTTFTVAHELGHYYANLFLDSETYSFDIAETHSQGNEMLLLHYMKSEMPSDVYAALVQFKVYSFASAILVATVMDEFEERVYTDTAFAAYTTEQFSETMKNIATEYGLPENLKKQVKDFWIDSCITSPVYYISYATSGVAALNLYGLCRRDPDAAREAYRRTVEEMDETAPFVGTLKNAGIPTPFEEAAFVDLWKLTSQ